MLQEKPNPADKRYREKVKRVKVLECLLHFPVKKDTGEK
jgi:hypothetical protein